MRNTIIVLIATILLAALHVPALAQDDAPIQIQITGTLAYQDIDNDGLEDVLVDGVVVLPTPGFYDLNFEAGQRVTVIGNLLPDGAIQATSLFLAPDEAEMTPGPTSDLPVEMPTPEDEREREQEQNEAEREREEAQREAEREREEAQREAEQEREEAQREREQEQRDAEQERDEPQREEQSVVEVSGEVTVVNQNYIVVDGVAVSSGGIFQPSQFAVGQQVRVTGIYENNGLLRALSIDVTTAENVQEAETSVDDGDTPPCIPESHPVVGALANEFALEADDLVDLHCAGYGFGDITRALLIAEQTGGDAQTYLQQYDQSRDWGEIARAAGLEPGTITPNRIIGSR